MYLTLLQYANPSIPRDDRLLRSCWGWRLGECEIKMIYHPRIAGAHTMEKIRDDFFFYCFFFFFFYGALRSCQAHIGLPQLPTLIWGSIAIHCFVPWQRALLSIGRPSNWLPGCTTTTEWGEGWFLKRFKATFLSALCVSLLPLTFYPTKHSSVSVCTTSLSLSVYLCFCLSLYLFLCVLQCLLFLILAHSAHPSVSPP